MSKRIYFYSPSLFYSDEPVLIINTTPLYIDGHLQAHYPDLHQTIEWTKVQLQFKTQQQLVDDINNLGIDIFCVSLYVWNHDRIMESIRGIKKLVDRPITVLAGGPSVNVYRNHNYLNEYPEIDFAVYAQGEEAFANILQIINGTKKPSVLGTKNIAWRDDAGRFRIADFEFIRKKTGSHYVEGQHILRQIVNDPDNAGFIFEIPYETSKGCPYDCTYCDWTSGLTHKVSKRKFVWEEELELLGSLGIVRLSISDANFGIYKDDIEIARTMARLKQEQGFQFEIHHVNFAKLHKKVSFDILEIFVSAGIIKELNFAVQDIDEQVLKMSWRPDVPWAEHRSYIDAFKKRHPEIDFHLELITGLPGQTRESWETTMIETFPYKVRCHSWVLLPNSPAGYNTEYQQQMQLKSIIANLEANGDPSRDYFGPVVVSTVSYNEQDYAYFLLLYNLIKDSKLRRIVDRRGFINCVKNSQHLDACLEEIKSNFGNSRKFSAIASNFLNLLIKEVKNWPAETARILVWWKTGIKHPKIIDDDIALLELTMQPNKYTM